MKALCTMAVLGLSLMASVGPASAQASGPGWYRVPIPDNRYRERDYDYRERGPRYRERDYDYDYRERGPRYRSRGFAFNEREYLRCNRDVRRAVRRGEIESGLAHYRIFGRREGRRLRC
jgi:hypothetical protein